MLCQECQQELIEARVPICIGCGKLELKGICDQCRVEWRVDGAAVFDARGGVLEALINQYKFNSKRSAAAELAELAAEILPYSSSAVLVPVPTIPRHIRERGYDHMALLTRKAAKHSRLSHVPLLQRAGSTVQHGASRRVRLAQADAAFIVNGSVHPDHTYIVFDDITTTGASLRAATRVLREAGARHVWAVALARQPLEETLDDRG